MNYNLNCLHLGLLAMMRTSVSNHGRFLLLSSFSSRSLPSVLPSLLSCSSTIIPSLKNHERGLSSCWQREGMVCSMWERERERQVYYVLRKPCYAFHLICLSRRSSAAVDGGSHYEQRTKSISISQWDKEKNAARIRAGSNVTSNQQSEV